MDPGHLDKRARFRRRVKTGEGGAGSRGAYADLFTVAASFRPLSARVLAEAGSLTDGIEASLVVRDTARTRDLTKADRVIVDGRDFAIESVPLSDRSGWLRMKLSVRKASA